MRLGVEQSGVAGLCRPEQALAFVALLLVRECHKLADLRWMAAEQYRGHLGRELSLPAQKDSEASEPCGVVFGWSTVLGKGWRMRHVGLEPTTR